MFLLRIFYFLYFCGLTIAIIASLSKFYFSRTKVKIRIKELMANLVFLPLYPFSIFSKEGRKKLTNFINKF